MTPAGRDGHDPLCPIARETWCLWPGDKCEKCRLIRAARADERDRIRAGVLAHYSVAPKAAEPMLRIVDGGQR